MKAGVSRREWLAGASASALAGLAGEARAQPPAPAAPPSGPVVVDVHCHNFCGADLPITGFVAHYLPGLSDLSRELTDVPERLLRAVIGELHRAVNLAAPSALAELADIKDRPPRRLPKPIEENHVAEQVADRLSDFAASLARFVGQNVDVKDVLRRAAHVIFMISHSRADITATLVRTYPRVSLFTPLLVDYDAWSSDPHDTALPDQIDVQAAIARLSMHGAFGEQARVHPFIAFDPARPDALELVKRAVGTAGFIGVKLYPAVGFAPTNNACLTTLPKEKALRIDAALDALYAYCVAEDVPITTHCSPGNEYGLGFRDLVAPIRWDPVLRKHPTLRLNLAHLGHDEGLDPVRGVRACESWLGQAARLMRRYPNVFGDLSGSALNEGRARAAAYATLLVPLLADEAGFASRLMYGSDWWLQRLFGGEATYLEDFQTSWTGLVSGRPALLAAVLGGNALRFLGFRGAAASPPTRNAARLRAFYAAAGATPPGWL